MLYAIIGILMIQNNLILPEWYWIFIGIAIGNQVVTIIVKLFKGE